MTEAAKSVVVYEWLLSEMLLTLTIVGIVGMIGAVGMILCDTRAI